MPVVGDRVLDLFLREYQLEKMKCRTIDESYTRIIKPIFDRIANENPNIVDFLRANLNHNDVSKEASNYALAMVCLVYDLMDKQARKEEFEKNNRELLEEILH